MGILDLLFNINSSDNDKDDGLTDEEREHLKDGYEPYNFEEDETEDDDYYYDDEKE